LVWSLLVGAVWFMSACAPDDLQPPTAPTGAGTVAAARDRDVTVITIIPWVDMARSGVDFGELTGINERGVAVGWREGPTGNFAFTWDDGVMTSLGSLFFPVAINKAGDVVGNDTNGKIVVWGNGVLTTLDVPGPASATDINDRGQIVGNSLAGAFLWDGGTLTPLGTLGGTASFATSINNHGQIVGYSQISGDGAYHAFLWERGVMTDLGTLSGGSSRAFAINDHGDIVGLSDDPLTNPRPFIVHKGEMTRLLASQGVLDWFSIAGISDAGHVIGTRAPAPFADPRAFVWRDGVLEIIGEPLTIPTGVNSSGEIAGYKAGGNFGLPGAYLWTVGRHQP
jgi:probable HAF family extracellular repeat protein